MSKNYNQSLQSNNTDLQAILDAINELPEAGSGGSSNPTAPINEVNFYDYDGTILYSYTVEEAQALTELPPLPTQPGLICQEWNYDLDTIKSYNRAVNIGATYITDDGKTRLYIKIAAEGRMTVPLYFSQTVSNGVTIDWGDGSVTQTLSGTGNKNTTHTYANIGEYVISLDVASGCTLGLGHNSDSYCLMGSIGNNGIVYCNMLQKVEIGSNITSIGTYAFQDCYSLASIVIPNSVTSIQHSAFSGCYSLASAVIPDSVKHIGGYAFQSCYSLANIVIPNSVTSIQYNAFSGCYSLANIVIPNSITIIENSVFYNCNSLASVVIPNSVTNIGYNAFGVCHSLASIVIPDSVRHIDSYAFYSCKGMAIYDFTSHTSVPTLASTDAFNGIPSDCVIKVPAALYDEWIAATNWSTYASRIVVNGDTGGDTGDDTIPFFIGDAEFTAEEGMTFAEWVDSSYNPGTYFLSMFGRIANDEGQYICYRAGDYVNSEDIIESNYSYMLG